MSSNRWRGALSLVVLIAAGGDAAAKVIGVASAAVPDCQARVDAALNQALYVGKNECTSDPNLLLDLQGMIASSKTARVTCKLDGPSGYSASRCASATARCASGVDTNVDWNIQDTSMLLDGDCPKDPYAELVHELLHAYHDSRGNNANAPGTPECLSSGGSPEEINATVEEDIYRRSAGICQRKSYCSSPLPSYAYNKYCLYCPCFMHNQNIKSQYYGTCSFPDTCCYNTWVFNGATVFPTCACPCPPTIGERATPGVCAKVSACL
jgi:hypothetical protein